ncbi:hypothetical protein DL93DRAFT_2080589 [Clavulina sp. PMI_390]|nr:hypothetical protein DL93DRAFT_2080589 [Clavulina sp. PMI_390]
MSASLMILHILTLLLQHEFLDPDASETNDQNSGFYENDACLTADVRSMSLSPVRRTFTNASTSTVISYGVLQMSLSELCSIIIERPSLYFAEILSIECYSERVSFITHRFLILHLRRKGRKDVYLRMDRRAGVGLARLLSTSGVSSARDEVRPS